MICTEDILMHPTWIRSVPLIGLQNCIFVVTPPPMPVKLEIFFKHSIPEKVCCTSWPTTVIYLATTLLHLVSALVVTSSSSSQNYLRIIQRKASSHGAIISTLCVFSVLDVIDPVPAKRVEIVHIWGMATVNSNCILLK